MNIKKLFFWMIAFCVLSSFALASLSDTDLVSVFAEDSNPDDSFGNNGMTDASMSYLSGASCENINCSDYDGTNSVQTKASPNNLTGLSAFTHSFWLYPDGIAQTDWISVLGNPDAFNDASWFVRKDAAKVNFGVYTGSGGSSCHLQTSADVLTDATWQLVVVRWVAGSSQEIWIDGVNQSTTTLAGACPATSMTTPVADDNYRLGSDDDMSLMLDGRIDEAYMWKTNISDEAIQELSTIFYPFPVAPVVNVSDSIENTAVFKQVGTTSVNSPVLTTIFSSDFETVFNVTDLYGVYTFNVFSNLNNDLFCQLDIDGVVVANQTRSNTAGDIGSMTLSSAMFNVTNGNHTQTLSCFRSGPGPVTISNAVGVGHFMFDELNRTINHVSASLSVATSSTSFTQVGGFNFTINNLTDSVLENSIVLEWSAEYENNAVGVENLSTYISINGSDCAFYPRTVAGGSIGSVGGDCILENVSTNATYEVLLFAAGSNAFFTGNIIAKQFFMNNEEIVGGTGILAGLNFSGVAETKLFNTTGENLNHALANAFSKLSYSLSANQSTDVTLFFRLVNGTTLQSVNFTRTIDESIGVLIAQDVFENLPLDTYELELWGSCPDATCTIVGGASEGYITDVTTTIFNSFNVTAVNLVDGSPILNFNVTDTNTVSSVNGTAFFFSEDAFENLTISSGNYFSNVTLNHNTSNNLDVSLYQVISSWSLFEKVTGLSVSTFSVASGSQVSESVAGVATLLLNAGDNQNVSFVNVSGGYFNSSGLFNFSFLEVVAVNASNAVNMLLNVSVFNILDASLITNFTGTVSDLSGFGFSESFDSSPNGYITLELNRNISYLVQLNPISGFANTNNSFVLSQSDSLAALVQRNISLFTNNSISINVFNFTSGLLVSNLTTITLTGDTITYTFTTENGTLFRDNLNDDTYRTTFVSEGFDTTTLYLTLTNSSHLDANVFLETGTLSRTFITQNNFGVNVPDITITFFRNINGTFVTAAQEITDFSGRATVNLHDDVVYRLVATSTGFNTFTGNVLPTESEYVITLVENEIDVFISIYEHLVYTTSYVQNEDNLSSTFIITSSLGELEYFGVNTSYNGVSYFQNVSASPAGGQIDFSIGPFAFENQTLLLFTYWFKLSGQDLLVWNETLNLNPFNSSEISLTGGLFDDLSSLPVTSPVRGLVATIIVVFLIIVLSSLSGNFTIGIVGGMGGLALAWSLNFLPQKIVLVTLAVLMILLVADNVGGAR